MSQQANIDININGQKANQTYQDLLSRAAKLNRELKGLVPGTDAFVKKSQELGHVRGEIGRVTQEVNKTKAAVMGLDGSMMKMIKTAGAAFAGLFALRKIVGVFTGASEAAADFEAQMSKVRAVSAGLSDEDFERLQDKAREMGRTTSKSATEAAEAMEYLALAGLSVEDQLRAIEPVLRLSEAGGLALGRASDLATDAMSALGLGVDQLGTFLDTTAAASTRANTSIEQLLEAQIKVGGQFKALNVPLDEQNALLGILANRGEKGSEAATGLNAVLINLTTGAGKAGDAMKQLGVSAFDSEGNFRGIDVVLKDLEQSMSGYTAEQQQMFKFMLAGKQNISTFNALLSGMTEEYDDLKSTLQDVDGVLNDVAAEMRNNLRGAISEMKSALGDVMITIGDFVNRGLLPVVKGITAMLLGLREVPRWLEENKGALIGLTTGLVLFNAQLIVSSVNSLRLAAAEKARIIWTKAATIAQHGLNAAMTANPVGLVIKAIGLLVMAFGVAYQKSETLRAGVAGLWEAVKEVGEIIIETFQKFAGGFKKLVSGDILGGLEDIGGAIIRGNPIGLAITEGGRLGQAFSRGYADRLASEAAKREAEEAARELVDAGNQVIKDNAISPITGKTISEKEKGAKDEEIINPNSLAGLRKQLGELRKEWESVDVGSEAFVRLGDEIEALDARIKAILDRKEDEDNLLDSLLGDVEADMKYAEERASIAEQIRQAGLTEREREIEDIEQHYGRLIELAEFYGLEVTGLREQMSQKLRDIAQRDADFEQQMQMAKVHAYADAAAGISDFLSADRESRKKHAAAIKAFEIGNIFANMYAEIQGYWKSAAALGPAGAILAKIQTAGAVIRSAAAARRVASTQFAEGGFTGSGLYADSTGHKVAGVVHNDEWVAPKWMTESPKFGSILGYLESARQRGFAEGGFTSTTPAPSVLEAVTGDAQGQMMLQAMQEFSQAVARMPKRVKADVVLADLHERERDQRFVDQVSSI